MDDLNPRWRYFLKKKKPRRQRFTYCNSVILKEIFYLEVNGRHVPDLLGQRYTFYDHMTLFLELLASFQKNNILLLWQKYSNTEFQRLKVRSQQAQDLIRTNRSQQSEQTWANERANWNSDQSFSFVDWQNWSNRRKNFHSFLYFYIEIKWVSFFWHKPPLHFS